MKRGFPEKIEPTLPTCLGKEALDALAELSTALSNREQRICTVIEQVQQIKSEAIASVVRQDDGVDWVEGVVKPVLASPSCQRRIRTSAAVMGLALSMGASDLLSAFQTQRAVAAETIDSKDETQRSAKLALELKALAESAQTELGNSIIQGEPPQVLAALASQNLSTDKSKFDFAEVDASTSLHVVQSGETLHGIARSYGIGAEQLALLNGLEPSGLLAIGATLKVPTGAQSSQRLAQAGSPDTGLSLTSSRPTSADPAIAQLRDRREALRQTLGQSAPLPASPSASQEVALSELTPYRVQAGDTLDSIARNFGVNRSELIALNRLENPSVLKVDQNIAIPKTASKPLTETLSLRQEVAAISDRAAAQVAQVSALPVQSGEVSLPSATVPPGSGSVAPLASKKIEPFKPMASATGSRKHRVQAGETLAKIARDYGISMSSLAQENRITDPDIIFVGQQLQLPVGSMARPTNALPGTVAQGSDRPEAVRQAITQPRPSTEPVAVRPSTSPATSAGYVDNLMAEIRELRGQYRSSAANTTAAAEAQPTASLQSAPSAQPISVATPPSAPKAATPVVSLPQPLAATLNTGVTQPASRSGDRVQETRSQETRSQEVRGQEIQVTMPIAPKVAQGEPQLLAAAALGSESYEPLAQSILSRSVSPDLPPLMSDPFMPGNSVGSTGYIWPAKGVISSGYGWRWGRMHKGIDIANDTGTPIHAAADGVVTYSAWADGYGNLVEITHPDGSITLYAHSHRNVVREGQRVRQGEHIADMGSTGRSTGPHLHFEIRPAGQGAVNPAAFLPANR